MLARADSTKLRLGLLALLVAVACLVSACLPPPGIRPDANGTWHPDYLPYQGVGAWVDAYDYVDGYQTTGKPAPLHTDVLVGMAQQGVKTVYLQVAKEDPRSPGDLIDPNLLGQWVTTAHSYGINVVGWYLPTLTNVDRDLQHLMAMFNFQVNGQTLDGIGVDIEARVVPDVNDRSARLVDLSRRLRAQTGSAVLSAIVVPPVVMDVINVNFWPNFPWAGLAPYYNVWMPMNYWTGRTQASGYHDGYRYTVDNISLIRQHISNPERGRASDRRHREHRDRRRDPRHGARRGRARRDRLVDVRLEHDAPHVDAGHPRRVLGSRGARPAGRVHPRAPGGRPPGVAHREPRRDGGGEAHPDRGPRRVQVRARGHAREEQRALAGLRDRVRGVLLIRGPEFAVDGDGDGDQWGEMQPGKQQQGGPGGAMDQLTPEQLAEMLYRALMNADEAMMRALARQAVSRYAGMEPAARSAARTTSTARCGTSISTACSRSSWRPLAKKSAAT